MKKIYIPVISLILNLLMLSCHKEKATPEFSGAIRIVNAIASYETAIKAQVGGGLSFFSMAPGIPYYSAEGPIANGTFTLGLPSGKLVPVRIIVVPDTLHFIYNGYVKAMTGDEFSLFISGPPEHPDTLLIKEAIPAQAPEVAGVRFVNLSPDAGELSINVAGEAEGSSVSSLAYQQASLFKTYGQSVNEFEIRDKNTGQLLTRYRFDTGVNSFPKGKNISVLIRWLRSGSPGIETIRMNHY